MKPTTLNFLSCIILIAMGFLNSSCSTLYKAKINAQFPPVSPIERKTKSVVLSSNELIKIDTASAGIYLTAPFISSTIKHFILDSIGSGLLDTSKLHIIDIEQISLVDSPGVYFDKQSIECAFVFDVKTKKSYTGNTSQDTILNKIKSFRVSLKGFVSPYFKSYNTGIDTLHFNPNVESIQISKLKLKGFFGINFIEKNLIQVFVNFLLKQFRDNINGIVPDPTLQVYIPISDQTKLSSIIKTPGLEVKPDKTINFSIAIGPKAILIDDQGMRIVTKLIDRSNLTLRVKAIGVIGAFRDQINEITKGSRHSLFESSYEKRTFIFFKKKSIAEKEDENRKKIFNEVYESYKNNFVLKWNNYLDPLLESGNSCRISYEFMAERINAIMSNADINLYYKEYNRVNHFDRTDAEFFDRPEGNCDKTPYPDCPLPDCNNVLSNCDYGCGKWNFICKGREVACRIANNVKYGACVTFRESKRAFCNSEYFVRKGACDAWLFLRRGLYYGLKPGEYEGDVTIDSLIAQSKVISFKIKPDLTDFIINEATYGDARIQGDFKLYSKNYPGLSWFINGLRGHSNLSCGINVSGYATPTISGHIEKINENNLCKLKLKTDEAEIYLKSSIPPILTFLDCFNGIQDPVVFQSRLMVTILALNAFAIWEGYTRITNQERFKDINDKIINGNFKLKKSKEFEFEIKPVALRNVPISSPPATIQLNPEWNNKSVVFKTK